MASETYITVQGDFWDLIAIKVYGLKRGDEKLMRQLLEANYLLKDMVQFPAGIAIVVPGVVPRTEIPLVPWKRATLGLTEQPPAIILPGPRGPMGDPGPVGPPGPRGVYWFWGNVDPVTVPNERAGDFYMNAATGDVFWKAS
jgi:phage tail protein X